MRYLCQCLVHILTCILAYNLGEYAYYNLYNVINLKNDACAS